MTFWLIAIALLALALIILLLPLVRATRNGSGDQRRAQNIQIAREQKAQLDNQLARSEIDQAAYDSAYLDLQTALALELEPREAETDRPSGAWMALVVLLIVPLASVALYFNFGEYRVIQDPALAEAPSQESHPSLDEMIAAIKEKLRVNPEDAAGWYALGRTFGAKRQFDQAVIAYQRAYDLAGEQPEILFSLADALAMQNNGNLLGEPERLIERGLELAPRYPNGLWLAGLVAEQRQDFKTAHRYWSLLLPLIADNPASHAEVQNLLTMLEQRDPGLVGDATAAVSAQLKLSVDISPELIAQAEPERAVFVYAKAMQGPPMPLAVRRLRVADLPISLTLSDADAMLPSMKLSLFPRVIVGARVSASGTATPQAGDFYTEIEGVDSANPPSEIQLVIDRVRQ